MASDIFLDANIIHDISLQRKGFEMASAIISAGISGNVRLYTSPSVLHISSYYTRKHLASKQTKRFFIALLNDVTVIECDHSTCIQAINSPIQDIEDALQYFTALRFGLDCFLSSDKKLKKVALTQLPVYTAAELLDIWKNSGVE